MTESPGFTSNNTNETNSVGSSFELVNTPTSSSFSEVQTPNSPQSVSSSNNIEQDGFDQVMTNTERSNDSVDINNPTTPNPDSKNNSNNNNDNLEQMDTETTPSQQQQQQQQETKEEEMKPVELEPELTPSEITELKTKVTRASLVIGEKWCPINALWYNKWAQNYYSREDLGAIDNSGLLQSDGQTMKSGLMESSHYVLVPEAVYLKLKAVYGGGPDIFRKVIKGSFNNATVDMKIPFPLQFVKSSEPQKIIDGYALKSESINQVKDRYCKVFELVPSEVKIWDFYKGNKHAELKPLEYVSHSNLLDNQLILLEEKNKDGTWPADTRQSYYNSYSSSNQRTGALRPGITGLSNLGNTCFMNSALQCLSNTYPITKYFLNAKHELDLNKTNPLGCNGELAQEYADLIKQIWKGDLTSVAPRGFKGQIEKFAPQFAGYHQHDSQELLAFLLDGLHEDLNKVLKKPFIESKDYDGRADQIIAKEHWEMHKARNNSVIVDWFQSQLKSKLVCPECAKISITFDPFMYLSLPLPTNSKKLYNILLVRLDCTASSIEAIVPSTVFGEAMNIVSQQSGLSLESLVFATVSNNSIGKILTQETATDIISLRDLIVAYEITTSDPTDPTITYSQVKVAMKPINASYYSSNVRFPFILSVPSTVNNIEDLYQVILQRLQPALKNQDEIRAHFESNQEKYDQIKQKEEEEKKQMNGGGSDENQPGNADDNDDHHAPSGYHRAVHDHRSSHFHSNFDRDRSMGMGTYPSPFYTSQRDSYSRYGSSYSYQQPTPDPRLIFQIIEVFKHSADKPISFPFKATELCLIWDENYENFLDVDICQPFLKNPHHKDIPSETDITLEQCIDLFTTEEQLGPDDPWYCSNCKDFKRATKKFDIWSAPPILVVHLKRFSYKKTLRDKLDIVVKFPLKDLDLSPFVLNKEQPTPLYDLYAVSNHFGSLGGGHYTAYALNELENQWYRFDDSSVSEQVNTSSIVSDAAYVLFYRRRDTLNQDFHLNEALNPTTPITTENNNNNTTTNNTTTTTTTTTTSTTTTTESTSTASEDLGNSSSNENGTNMST